MGGGKDVCPEEQKTASEETGMAHRPRQFTKVKRGKPRVRLGRLILIGCVN